MQTLRGNGRYSGTWHTIEIAYGGRSVVFRAAEVIFSGITCSVFSFATMSSETTPAVVVANAFAVLSNRRHRNVSEVITGRIAGIVEVLA